MTTDQHLKKAGSVLHVLQQEMGDEQFHKAIREYYAKYQNNNALTIDFRYLAEANVVQALSFFFD